MASASSSLAAGRRALRQVVAARSQTKRTLDCSDPERGALLGVGSATSPLTTSGLSATRSQRIKFANTQRSMSTSSRRHSKERQTLELAFEHYSPAHDANVGIEAEAVVLCHGLFGSKQNWRSISKSLAQRTGVPVYAIDLRNHGTSPHAATMRYDEMAGDLLRFFRDHKIRNAVLVGHSLGGKAVQSMALDSDLPRDSLSHLISVDMTPARGPLSAEFARYVEAMIKVQQSSCKTRDDAAKILSEVEPNIGIVQFLSTNLYRAPDSQFWGWRIPLETIQQHLPSIGDFPYDDPEGLIAKATEDGQQVKRPERSWSGKTLFIKGEKSKYINHKNIPICKAFFPQMQLETLPTGHWVQAEKPREFVDLLVDFTSKA